MALQPQPVTARQLQLQQQQQMRSQQAAAAQQAPPARQGGNFPTLKIKVGHKAWHGRGLLLRLAGITTA